MNDKTRNEFANYGLEMLKYAVLDVLNKERAISRQSLLRIEISERLGLPGEYGSYIYSGYNAELISGILHHLDDYVEDTGGNRWRITPKGVKFIES